MTETHIDMARFAAALTKRRLAQRLSKRKLAERAGISGPYVGELEQGTGSRPGIEVLARIAAALKTTPDELLADFGLPTRRLQSAQIDSLYSDLDDIQRRALLQIGHALREAQEAYETRDIGRLASFSGATQEEQEQAKRDALDSGEHPD